MGKGLRITSVILAAVGVLVLTPASPVTGTADASACNHGAKRPGELTTRQARRSVRCLVNLRRNSYGVARLSMDRRLQKAASRHTRRMTSDNCFAHQCPGEAPLAARLFNVGYLVNGLTAWRYGEAIAWGRRSGATPRSIVRAWMNSPVHRASLLSRGFEHLGVGYDNGAPTSANAGAATYTVDLGFRSG